jgi:hypothetical protein
MILSVEINIIDFSSTLEGVAAVGPRFTERDEPA